MTKFKTSGLGCGSILLIGALVAALYAGWVWVMIWACNMISPLFNGPLVNYRQALAVCIILFAIGTALRGRNSK